MQIVHVRINDAATNKPTPVRLRITDAAGNYYAPLGRLTEFSTSDNQDVGGNVLFGGKTYCHIDGACEVALPAGRIIVEASKGFEFSPLRQEIELKPGQLAIRLAITRWCDSRTEGWYCGDTRAQFLSPHAALLEAAAEDLAIVQLLACAWQENGRPSLPNLLAFSGQANSLEMPGHAVAVNTLNTSPLGKLALLHCHRVVHPLHVEHIDWTLSDWCEQCHRKRGLVIWPEALDSPTNDHQESEALANLLLGKIDALETSDLSWCRDTNSPYYDLLNCGVRVPLVGASGKKSNTAFLGSVRTYARLPSHEAWSGAGWIEAMRGGRTIVSDGPMLNFTINGAGPGTVIDAATDSRLQLHAQSRSLSEVQRLQIVRNGEVIREASGEGIIDADLPALESGWWVARCFGRERGTCAHSSPIHVDVGKLPMRGYDAAIQRVQQRLQRFESRINELSGGGHFASDKDERRVRAILEAARQRIS